MKRLGLSASTALKIALGCFIGLGLFMYQRYEQSVAGVGITTAAEDLEGATSAIRSLLAEAETSARGYALTAEPRFLDRYTQAATGTAAQLERLRELAGASSDQQRRMAELDVAVQDKILAIKRLVDLRRTQNDAAIRTVVADDAKGARNERIAFLTRAMVDDMWAALNARLEQHQRTVATTRWLMVGLFGLAIALLMFAALRISRELRRRLEAEFALRTAYAQVEERVRQRTAELVSTNSLLRESQDKYRQLADQKEQALAERSEALTREQAARAEAELANRFRDRFLATVSHELRTPLNAIVGWTHLLRAGMMDNPARALEAIDRNAALQARLIDDLLDVSRMEQGRFSMAPVVLDFRAVVRAALGLVEPAADAKSIRIDATISDAPVTVLGDQRRLQQAIVNLFANAVKFSTAGGTVQVALSAEDGRARLEVQDAGEGIDATFLPHVFQAFRQDTTRPARAGLGLGLAIARGIIERHQGTITVNSDGRNRGTRFSVTLPLGSQDDLAVPMEPVSAATVHPDRTTPVHAAHGVVPVTPALEPFGGGVGVATRRAYGARRRKRVRLLPPH